VTRAIALQSALAAPESLLIGSLGDVGLLGSHRGETVADVRARVGQAPLIWIHGAHGVGKSTLCKLVANAYGGEWLAIDLKPLAGKSDAILTAWRSLHQIVLMNGMPDGVIIDDFDQDAVLALWPRLKAFARILFERGGRLLLNSHQAPSPARIAELGLAADVIIQAPYFTQAEITDLLRQAPAPLEDEREPWAFFIRGATGGGHPVLVSAKVASLRSRAWPKAALLEDVGPQSSDAVRATRQEARQILLREIGLLGEERARAAGRMLRRIASIVDRVDEALILRLAEIDPDIEASTDLLALLKGSWLELMPGGDLRVSPLLGDIADDVSDDDKKTWRCTASIHWMAGRVLNERTIPLIFWNAYLGRQEWVLGKFCQVLFTQSRQALGGAAALLSPIMVFSIETPIYSGHALINANLRLLQFEVAETLEHGAKAAAIAKQLIADINAIEISEVRPMMTAVACSKVLMAAHAETEPKDVVRYALLLRQSLATLQASGEEDLLARWNAVVAEFDPSLDQASFLFANSISKIATSADFLGLIEALDPISEADRNIFLDASSVAFDGLSVFVNSGWSRDQLEDRDMQAALETYQKAASIAERWKRPDIMIQLAAAISVLFDEGLKNETAALAAIDEAIAAFGPDQALIRQKAKVFGHYDRDEEAADLIVSVEDSVGGDSFFDRALALRDGATSAARAGRFGDAARLYTKAAAAVAEKGVRRALLAGLNIDRAMATWDSGDRAGALGQLADVFDQLAAFEPQSSRQAERAHQFGRGVGGLFAFDVGIIPGAQRPNIAYGGASALSTDDEPLLDADLKPLADNWRILTLVERASELDIGIGARSRAAQTGPGLVATEFLFFLDDYARSLRRGDLGEILVMGVKAASALVTATEATAGGDGMVRADASALGAIPLAALLARSESKEALYRIPTDVLIYARLRGAWSERRVDELQRACEHVFGGSDPWFAPFFEVAHGRRTVAAQAPMPVWGAAAAAMSEATVRDDPGQRFKRD
ncbi:MAG TPA: hypothetical protein VEA63_12510, partial [Opitutus sp.]|nr:hypothetical protein [Opitutus sp.]